MDFLKTHIDFIILGTLGLMSFIMLWKVVERYLFFARLDVRRYPNIHELNIALERNLTPIYTIGSNAPYVSLLGTVTGILITFYDMGQHGGNIDAAQIMIGLALAQALADQPKALDKQGDWFYELLSAFHKSLRGSNPDGAMYWFARMVDGGADPLVIARRMLCVASEDIGNADPNALNLALNAYQTYERLGAPRRLPRPRAEKQRQLQSDESRLCLRPREPRPPCTAAPAQRPDRRAQKRRLRHTLPLRPRRTASLRRWPNLPAGSDDRSGRPLLPAKPARL